VPEKSDSRSVRAKGAVAWLLTFASGNVDILGFIGIYKLFTAHVTGTSVQLARSLVRGNWPEAAIAGVLVGAFFLVSIVGRAIIEAGARTKFRKIASVTLALEAVMIGWLGFSASSLLANPPGGAGVTTFTLYVLIGTLSCAMGLQTATLTAVGPLTVHTTFVTGMINKLAEITSHVFFGAYDLIRKTSRQEREVRSKLRDDCGKAGFLFGIWVAYVAGAATGTWLYRPLGLRAMFVSVALLVVAIGADQVWGLSRQEEKEQSES